MPPAGGLPLAGSLFPDVDGKGERPSLPAGALRRSSTPFRPPAAPTPSFQDGAPPDASGRAIPWADLIRRVFAAAVLECLHGGGRMVAEAPGGRQPAEHFTPPLGRGGSSTGFEPARFTPDFLRLSTIVLRPAPRGGGAGRKGKKPVDPQEMRRFWRVPARVARSFPSAFLSSCRTLSLLSFRMWAMAPRVISTSSTIPNRRSRM